MGVLKTVLQAKGQAPTLPCTVKICYLVHVRTVGRTHCMAWFATTALLQVVMVTGPTWLRARGFGYSNYDFGIYSQALAQLARNPPNPWLSGRQINVFNDHFDPILFMAAPFARLLPAAQVGLVAEALFALLALLPLSWMALEGNLQRRSLWLLGGLLSFHLGVTQALGFPFHPTTWAMAPMAWLLAALVLERWRIALAALVVLLCCKEEFPFVGLALTPFVFLRGPRKFGWAFVGISAAWALFAFVLRPRILGEVMAYSAQPFQGLSSGLVPFLAQRLSAKALSGFGYQLVAFAPVGAWLAFERYRTPAPPKDKPSTAWIWLCLVPMLAIRGLSIAWGDHYLPAVIAAVVVGLAALISTRTPPTWVMLATGAALLVTNQPLLKRNLSVAFGPAGWAMSSGCVDPPGRRDAVSNAVEKIRLMPGPLLVSGNVLPWLAERDDVYAFGGPAPSNMNPRAVLLERPPCGDTWAMSESERENLYALWQNQPDFENVVQDEFVLLTARKP